MRPLLLAIALLVLCIAANVGRANVVSATDAGSIVGDADCNTSVNPLDALGILHHVSQASDTAGCLQLADVNCDGVVDQIDAIELLRYWASVGAGNIPDTCAAIGSSSGLPPITVSVDTSIDTPPDIPGVDGNGPARPLDVIQDEEGNQTVFVAHELLIVTDDTNELNDFLTRWNGTVVKTVNPHDYGIDMPTIYLVHLNPSGVDTSHIADNLRTVHPVSWGQFGISSDDAAQLLAVAAGEAASGMHLDLNWVLSGDTYDQRELHEAATGPGGWNPNPFTWTYMNRFSVQDTGAADAWRALAANDKLGNKVKISILDGGFVPNADFPAGYSVHGSTNVENPATCTGGSSCPWHGTMVTGAAMGVPDNNFGVAGPGGPIAQAIITQSPSSDILSYLEYIFINLPATALESPDIINISAGSGIASEWCLTGVCSAMDGVMRGVRALNMLVFAAAGNDHTNVDEQKCVDLVLGSICYERTVWLPCELDDVVCVGGLADNSNRRATDSNYGTDTTNTVDIFGPFYQYQTPDPIHSGVKFGACGTSCATPFVAGVAAEIKAADPGLDADGIENLLITAAHLDTPDPVVPRWVDAYHAVIAALGGNEPPSAFMNLTDGDTFGGLPFHLEAYVTDPEERPTLVDPYNGSPVVTWRVDGNIIGTGLTLDNVDLGYGQHTVTMTAVDAQGAHVTDVANLNLTNDPPTVHIVQPADGASYYTGQSVHFKASTTDGNYVDGKLPDSALQWYQTAPGDDGDRSTPVGQGHDLQIVMPAEGDYDFVLVGTDDQNVSAQDVVANIHVGPAPANLPPTATIEGEVDQTHSCDVSNAHFTLHGHANDPEDGALTGASLVWEKSSNGINWTFLGNGEDLDVPDPQFTNGVTWHIRLTATDGDSNTGTDQIDFYWDGCLF